MGCLIGKSKMIATWQGDLRLHLCKEPSERLREMDAAIRGSRWNDEATARLRDAGSQACVDSSESRRSWGWLEAPADGVDVEGGKGRCWVQPTAVVKRQSRARS